jgi:uroporphyrinogen decarboxylase
MGEQNLLPSFDGLEVAAFESRHSAEMATLISRYRGVPRVAPSMREVPLEANTVAFTFAEELLAGHFNAVIFTTGVGAQTLIETLETQYERDRVIRALSEIIVVARGPKAARVLRDFRIPVSLVVPDPSTWQVLLSELDLGHGGLILPGSHIALQEYGASNDHLLEELRKREAHVFPVPVYRWDLPEDIRPLQSVLEAIVGGRVRVILFTNAVQVIHVLKVAGEMGAKDSLGDAFTRSIVCSIGPTCSEALNEHGVTVDLEPEPHKMGALVYEAARQAVSLLKHKDGGMSVPKNTIAFASRQDEKPAAILPPWHQSRFMKACRCEPVDATPVWLMRQAGRYLPEYRALRARIPFLELCKSPDRVAEITVGAADRIGADAAILFADLLLIAEPMGFRIDYEEGPGPFVRPLLRTPADLNRLKEVEPENSLAYLFEAIQRARARLDAARPLIGFAGAPFTLASYLIEGGPSKSFRHTKTLMYRDPRTWHALMDYLSRNLARYVQGEIEAGVQAVQIFDSWVGCLGPADYREFVLPHTRSLIRGLAPGVPIIHFATGAGLLLEDMRDAGGTVIGLDFRTDLARAWEGLGPHIAVQGNLDPVVLYADPPYIRQRVRRVLQQAAGRPGHIFNLGHGVLPATPVENVIELVKMVHEESRRIVEDGR